MKHFDPDKASTLLFLICLCSIFPAALILLQLQPQGYTNNHSFMWSKEQADVVLFVATKKKQPQLSVTV